MYCYTLKTYSQSENPFILGRSTPSCPLSVQFTTLIMEKLCVQNYVSNIVSNISIYFNSIFEIISIYNFITVSSLKIVFQTRWCFPRGLICLARGRYTYIYWRALGLVVDERWENWHTYRIVLIKFINVIRLWLIYFGWCFLRFFQVLRHPACLDQSIQTRKNIRYFFNTT